MGGVAGHAWYGSKGLYESFGFGGVAAGGIFSKGALGMGFGARGPINSEEQRDASARATEYVGVLNGAATEIKDTFGVYILTDVS